MRQVPFDVPYYALAIYPAKVYPRNLDNGAVALACRYLVLQHLRLDILPLGNALHLLSCEAYRRFLAVLNAAHLQGAGDAEGSRLARAKHPAPDAARRPLAVLA